MPEDLTLNTVHCEHPTPLRGHESAKNDPVIPAQAGIQAVQSGFLDSGLRQNDGASSSRAKHGNLMQWNQSVGDCRATLAMTN